LEQFARALEEGDEKKKQDNQEKEKAVP